MSRIAIDIDSTLYDFASLACRVMGEMAEEPKYALYERERLRNGAYSTTWTEWRTPIDLVGEREWEEVVDRCHTPERILTQIPYDGAPEALWDLDHAGHELVFVSNRSPATYLPTRTWLLDMGFPLTEDNDLRCHTEDKLASIRDCQYLIDDRPKTLVGFVAGAKVCEHEDHSVFVGRGCRKAFGLVTPYNRGLTDVPGIYLAPNWHLLARFLRTKIGSVPSEC